MSIINPSAEFSRRRSVGGSTFPLRSPSSGNLRTGGPGPHKLLQRLSLAQDRPGRLAYWR